MSFCKQSSTPILFISPCDGLIDEMISIQVSQIVPGQEITMQAKTDSADGTVWTSYANFQADAFGEVDLQSAIPLQGSYNAADSMGLIWSMQPENGNHGVFQAPSSGMVILFTLVVDGKKVTEIEVRRLHKSGSVKREYLSTHGFIGTLFVPKSDKPLPLVITFSGSGGGLKESRAEILASHGFATLALAYFGCEGVPARLENIPLEYFERAIEWVKKRPEVDGTKVGLWGVSRGGELALLLGAMFPEKIQAIAAYVPSSVVYGSQESGQAPAWTYHGAEILPPAPFLEEESVDSELGKTADRPIPLSSYCLNAILSAPEEYTAAAIPVEKIKAALLVVAGLDDQMWPSGFFAEEIAKRLNLFHSKIERNFLIYENAGHRIAPPYFPVGGCANFHPIAKRWLGIGGKSADNAFAGKDAWEKTLSFFSRILHHK